MSCQQSKTNIEIEDIIKSRDENFKKVLENIDLYKKIVKELFTIYKNVNNKKKFDKEYFRLSRNKYIKVSKIFTVYVYNNMIRNNEIEYDQIFMTYIQKCPARNMSGVNSFAILLSPEPDGRKGSSCQHNCYYCPDETIKNGSNVDMPRSYLLKEPAVQRGYNNGWDAINQMNDRLNSLMVQGHEVDKLELIIEGGTYTEFPENYLRTFHRDIFYAANTFFDANPKREKKTIKEEMDINIYTNVRIIGICIETRPDAISYKWLKFFRETGTTRVQLGVQHTDDNILKKINRGHTFQTSCDAVELLKNNCFKVDIHLMPDLPYSNPDLDKKMFNLVFNTDAICPDQVKIYPCEVTPYTVIDKWYKSGKYKPYCDETPELLLDVVEYAMLICPPWVRLPRVVRDIPLTYILGGNKYSNLRQMIETRITQNNIKLNEIRFREIGRNLQYMKSEKMVVIRKYNKIDYFISYESYDKRVIFGFIRLRLPVNHSPYFSSIKNKGLIRELHVYNSLVPVGKQYKTTQHKGIGKMLLKRAELITWLNGYNGIAVISGEGVKSYYYKRGYKNEKYYLIKTWYSIYYYITFAILHLLYIICFIIYNYYNKKKYINKNM